MNNKIQYIKKKNPVAKELRTPQYKSQKIKSKKNYNRKEDPAGLFKMLNGQDFV